MTRRDARAEGAGHERWVWLSLLPLGLGSWAPIVPGARYRVPWWTTLGVFWGAVTVTGYALSGSEPKGHDALAGGVLLFAWAGGLVTSFVVRAASRRLAVVSPGAVGQEITSARRARWPWVSLLPLGLGSWAPLIAAARCRDWLWALTGFAGPAVTIAGLVLAGASSPQDGPVNQNEAALGFLFLMTAWIGGIGASFAIRPSYDERRGFPALDPPAWPRPTTRSLHWSTGYALIAFAGTFVAAIVIGLFVRYVMGAHIAVGEAVLLFDAILLAGLVPLAQRRGLSLTDLGIRPTLAMPSLGLVVLAFLAYFTLAGYWSIAFISHSTSRAANILSGIHHLGTFQIVLAVIAASLSAPIVEELFFRGLLYRSLRNRLPIYQAALFAGALFGLVHITGYPLITLPVKALFGVLACLLYERTGSLLPGIALHSFVDASVTDISLTGNDYVVLIIAGTLTGTILLRAALLKLTRRARLVAPLVGAPEHTPRL